MTGDDLVVDAIVEAKIERALRSGPDCVTCEATAERGAPFVREP